MAVSPSLSFFLLYVHRENQCMISRGIQNLFRGDGGEAFYNKPRKFSKLLIGMYDYKFIIRLLSSQDTPIRKSMNSIGRLLVSAAPHVSHDYINPYKATGPIDRHSKDTKIQIYNFENNKKTKMLEIFGAGNW